jgi:hypothetical protein
LQIANDGATFSGALTATSVTATDIAGGTGTFGTHAKIGSVAATARYYADGTNNISMTPTGGATYFSNQGASVTYGYFNATGLTVTGTGSFSGALTGTSATFSGNVGGVGLTLSDGWLELYNANVLQLYSTPTTAGANYETFALDKPDAGNARLRVYKSGTGTYRGMEFQTGGSARLTISAAGAATFSGALTSTGDFTTEGYVQHTSYLYSRNNLAVLNAAGTGWNTWATRSNGQFNLNVGTITSGALTATSVNVSGAIKKAGASWGTWTETLYTANGGSKSCRIVEDWTGRWIVVGRFAANAMTSIQGNIPTVSGLSTSTGQSTATQFSCDWGDSKPTEVRIMGATDFANYYTSRTVDWIWGVPTGRAWKYFFTDGNASGMTHGGASGSLTPGGNTNRWGWECRGAYDGRGRWSNPGYRFHKMSDGNPTITAAAFTSANGSAMNLETASDAKFTVHSNRVHSGQDGYMTSGFGNDDNIQGFFDAYESNTSGHVSNMNDGTDEYSSAVWVMIKLDGLASNMLKVEAECPDNFAATIKNTSTDDGSGLRIDTTATTNTDLYALGIYTNSNTGVFIENDGKLAIGSTTAGAYELYVNGTGFFKENLELDSTLSVGGALTATSGTFSSTLSAGTTSVVSSGPLTVFRTGAGDVGMIATFRGSGGLRQLQIANYLCGSDTDRAGLYWENQNVGNIRMWMGEDLVLRQKTSTPTSATDGDRYVKESSGNISTGAGTFSGAVTSDSVGTFVSSCGIRHAGGNGHLGRFYETGSDGFLELSTGHNPTVVRTKISSYGVSYFTPTGTNAGVGIGTTAPGAYKLYVNGNTWVQGSLETSGQLKAGTSVAIGSAGSGGYTLPAADGTNGYVLKTNGSGTVAWAADSSGGGSGDITSVIGGNAIDVSGGSSGDATVNHANTSSQSSVYCANYTVIEDVVLDAYGHVTGLATKLVGDTTGFALVSYGTCGVKLTWTEAGSAETDIAYPASCGGGGGS